MRTVAFIALVICSYVFFVRPLNETTARVDYLEGVLSDADIMPDPDDSTEGLNYFPIIVARTRLADGTYLPRKVYGEEDGDCEAGEWTRLQDRGLDPRDPAIHIRCVEEYQT